jgi:hypothetical protein
LTFYKLKSGIPARADQRDQYIEQQAKEENLISQWVQDYQSKFGEYEEAKPIIVQIEEALKLYKDVILASKVKLDIQRAREARKAQGSVLEYGLDHHLSGFVDAVKKGIPTDKSAVDGYIEAQSKTHNLLLQWLDDFSAKFEEHEDAKPIIKSIEEALALYKEVIEASKVKIDVQKVFYSNGLVTNKYVD